MANYCAFVRMIVIAIFLVATTFTKNALAIDSCSIVSGCPTGDAALGVNFTGLQPTDLNAGTFTVTATGADGFSCSFGSGTADNSSSCTAHYNSGASNIECLIEHLDCRNNPFDFSVSAPAGYSCSASPSSTSLSNCSNNSPITVSCTAPGPTCQNSCGACASMVDKCGNTVYQGICNYSTCTSATATYTCTALGNNSCQGTYTCGSACAPLQTVTIGGRITNSAGQGISGVQVSIYDNNLGQTQSASTDGNGNFSKSNFVRTGDDYAVRAPLTPVTFNQINYTSRSPSSNYESQRAGGGSDCRTNCNFSYTAQPPPTLQAQCSVNPISASTDQNVTWTADVRGGTSPFTYSWSGTDSLQGKTGNPTTVQYTSAGTKTGSVRVTDSTGTQSPQTNCSNSVTIIDPFNYSISNTGNITVKQGSSGSTTINLTKLAGTAQSVSLSSSSSLPAGATKTITPASCSPNATCSSAFTVSTSSTTPIGTTSITTTGTSSGLADKSTSFNLIVQAGTGNPPPTVDLKVNNSNGPITLTNNSSATLSWTTTNNPTTCTASGSWSGAKSTSTSGSTQSIGPLTGPTSYTYTLACANTNGSNSDTVVVNVLAPASAGPFCGDGVCNGSESTATCSQDCPPPPSSANCPWIQTTGGDVHSNTSINTPCGP